MTNNRPPYDPRLSSLVQQRQEEWGNDPVANRKDLVPYGIKHLDGATWGINVRHGELITMQGQSGHRKTTLAINVAINVQLHSKNPVGMVIDTLESGMTPYRYTDSIIANLATRYLIKNGHVPQGYTVPGQSVGRDCPVCTGYNGKKTPCLQMKLSPEYLMYSPRTKDQKDAIQWAIETMSPWPIHIYGAPEREGSTRILSTSVTDPKSRWKRLIDDGFKIFVSDHIQQYSFESGTSDYEKQIRGVAGISDVVAGENIVCLMLSQVSMGSVREARTGVGKEIASGGLKLESESNVVINVSYTSFSGKMKMLLTKSRKSGQFHFYQQLEETSGAFYGDSYIIDDEDYDPIKVEVESGEQSKLPF